MTANDQSVDALMYYTSATQIAALLPSNAPVAGPDSGNAGIQATIVFEVDYGVGAIDAFQGEGSDKIFASHSEDAEKSVR